MTTEVTLNSSSPYLSKPLPLAWATIDSESCMDQAGAAARIIRTKSATNLRITRMGSLPQSLRISLPLLARWGDRNTVSFDRLLTGEPEVLGNTDFLTFAARLERLSDPALKQHVEYGKNKSSRQPAQQHSGDAFDTSQQTPPLWKHHVAIPDRGVSTERKIERDFEIRKKATEVIEGRPDSRLY